MKIMHRDAQLPKVALAVGPGRSLANSLDGGHEEANQDRYNGDYNQQLNQGECLASQWLSFHGNSFVAGHG
jgi:hypothetical protein